MIDMKCPICGGDLIKGEKFPWFYSCQSTNWKSDADEICELDDCAASVPVWETLRRTRKALELAITGLKNCKTRDHIGAICRTPEYVDKILEQITALEQKEHFADISKKIK